MPRSRRVPASRGRFLPAINVVQRSLLADDVIQSCVEQRAKVHRGIGGRRDIGEAAASGALPSPTRSQSAIESVEIVVAPLQQQQPQRHRPR